jgi:hypothetical protein
MRALVLDQLEHALSYQGHRRRAKRFGPLDESVQGYQRVGAHPWRYYC